MMLYCRVSNQEGITTIVVYTKSSDIAFGSDLQHFFGELSTFTYWSDGSTASVGGSNQAEVYGGDMSSSTTGVGCIGYSMFSAEVYEDGNPEYDASMVAYAPPAYDMSTLANFNSNKASILTYMQMLSSAPLIEITGQAFGFVYDPAKPTGSQYIEVNPDDPPEATWNNDDTDPGLTPICTPDNFKLKLGEISSDWAEITFYQP